MKQRWKRILSMFMSANMVLATVPTTAFAEELLIEDVGMSMEYSASEDMMMFDDDVLTVDEPVEMFGSDEMIIEEAEGMPSEESVPDEGEITEAETNAEGENIEAEQTQDLLDSEEVVFVEEIEVYADELPEYFMNEEIGEPQTQPENTIHGVEVREPEGTGTVEDPYILKDSAELYWFAGLVNGDSAVCNETTGIEQNYSASAELGANIVVNDIAVSEDCEDPIWWNPIGYNVPYSGTFDGNGFSISGLYTGSLNEETGVTYPNAGLFAFTNTGADVEDVTVKNSYFCGSSLAGGIAAQNISANGFENCHNEATVCVDVETVNENSSISYAAGGIVGYNTSGTIVSCSNHGKIQADGSENIYAGGICGINQQMMSNCYNTGAVTVTGTASGGRGYAGGLAGICYSGKIENCYNTGIITGSMSGASIQTGAVCGIDQSTANGAKMLMNCFYLQGTAAGAVFGGDVDGAAAVDANTLMSGAVAWQLNGSNGLESPVWRQNLTFDEGPVLDSAHGIVYEITTQNCKGENIEGESLGYTNSVADSVIVLDHVYEHDFCSVCGEFDKEAFPEFDTEAEAYRITTADELKYFSMMVNKDLTIYREDIVETNAANAYLADDIVMNDGNAREGMADPELWIPIGTESVPYAGTFDGKDHSVSGLYYNDTDSSSGKYAGLFGNVSGTVKNLTVAHSYISGYDYVGGIAGKLTGTLSRVSAQASVVKGSNQCTAGIAGWSGGTIINVYNGSEVYGADVVGGIIGLATGGSCTNAVNTGAVYETTDTHAITAGSIYGYDSAVIAVTNCYVLEGRVSENGTIRNETNYVYSQEQFECGEVAYLINGKNSEQVTWYQVLGSDEYPSLDAGKAASGVVYKEVTYNCQGVSVGITGYNNTGDNEIHQTHEYANGFCTHCGEVNPEEISVPATDANGVYQIGTDKELYWFAGLVNGSSSVCSETVPQNSAADAVLIANITVNSGTVTAASSDAMIWNPIGIETAPYTGTFDGQKYSVSGLYYNNPTEEAGSIAAGLFGYTNGASISNLGVENSYFCSYTYAGSIVGKNIGTITNCYSLASVASSVYAGGIAGYTANAGEEISGCFFAGSAHSDARCGGIIASADTYGTSAAENVYLHDGNLSGTQMGMYGEKVTQGDVLSGGAAYILNGNKSTDCIWYQNLAIDDDNELTADPYPVWDASHGVVYADFYMNCGNSKERIIGYNNTAEIHTTGEHNYLLNAVCEYCGQLNADAEPDLDNGVYQIDTAAELYWFAGLTNGDSAICNETTELTQNNKANAVLTKDIVVNEGTVNGVSEELLQWTPIGAENDYTGTFDGRGYTISGLYCNYDSGEGIHAVGLIGKAGTGSVVRNVGIVNSYFSCSGDTASVVGNLVKGTVSGCYSTAVLYGGSNTGGIVGHGYDCTVSKCWFGGKITDNKAGKEDNFGGIVGATIGGVDVIQNGSNGNTVINRNSIVEHCYNTGTISCIGNSQGVPAAGGIVGLSSSTTLRYVYNIGTISSTNSHHLGAITGCIPNGDGSYTRVIDAYALSNSCVQLIGQNNYSKNTTRVEFKTDDVFASGEVTYYLNGQSTVNPVWYQTIDSDEYPTLNASHGAIGIKGSKLCPDRELVISEYTNNPDSITIGEHIYTDGMHCEHCGNMTNSLEPTVDANGVYQIDSAEDLYWFAALVNGTAVGVDGNVLQKRDASAVLIKDIIFNEDRVSADNVGTAPVWNPIGDNSANGFAGKFDGNGYSISGLYCADTVGEKQYIGLFGYTSAGAVINNVVIRDSYFEGTQYAGSVVGYAENTVISNCINYSDVAGTAVYAGGIAGQTNEGEMNDCINYGNVNITSVGTTYIGGLVGRVYSGTEIIRSIHAGSVTCTGIQSKCAIIEAGGIVGEANGLVLTDSCNIGSVRISGYATSLKCISGIAGYSASSKYNYVFTNGTLTKDITSATYGTFIGHLHYNNYFTNCYYNSPGVTHGSGKGVISDSSTIYEMDDEEFASGEVTWKLNGSSSEKTTWRQTIGQNMYPVLSSDSSVVYEQIYENCIGQQSIAGYTNDPEDTYSSDSHKYEDGFCISCGRVNPELMPKMENGVYQIETALDLKIFAALVNGRESVCYGGVHQEVDADAVLLNDIVINEGTMFAGRTDVEVWDPIGNGITGTYNGEFDGNGHTVSGLYVTAEDSVYAGLFGTLTGEAQVRNLTVSNSWIEGSWYAGGITGVAAIRTSIERCSSDAVVYVINSDSGQETGAGGVAGYNDGRITACINRSEVVFNGLSGAAGGIAGQTGTMGQITSCYSIGNVSVTESETVSGGGICGMEAGSGSVTYCCYLNTTYDETVDFSMGTAMSAEQMRSGEAAYMLNSDPNTEDYWRQNLGSDRYPVLDTDHALVYEFGYMPCPYAELIPDGYSNEEMIEIPVGRHDFTENVYWCEYCGMWKMAEQSADGYYEIDNIYELYWFAEFVNGAPDFDIEAHPEANARLTADLVDNEHIDNLGNWSEMTDEEYDEIYWWWPIGEEYSEGYSGIFDGNGHTISKLCAEGWTDIGLFGKLNGAEIKNLGLIDCYFFGRMNTGSIAGEAADSDIRNCFTENGGVYTEQDYCTGGLVGSVMNVTLSRCQNDAEVVSQGYRVGGLVGYSEFTSIENCCNTGTVSGRDVVGGLIGYMEGGKLTDSYNYGLITGEYENQVGGFAGYKSYTAQVENCYYLDKAAADAFGIQDNGEVNSLSVDGTLAAPDMFDSNGEVLYARSSEAFAGGEVTFLLNGQRSDETVVWKQQIGTNAYPVLNGGSIVYAVGERNCSGKFISFEGYTNISQDGCEWPDHQFINSACTVCGQIDMEDQPEKNGDGVYQIGTAAELFNFASIVNGTHKTIKQDVYADAVLTADISVQKLFDENGELPETPEGLVIWTPIGDDRYNEETYRENRYRGSFDGNGYSISGLLSYEETELPLGLFGYTENAVVRNVTVTDSMFIGGYGRVGGIVGCSGSTEVSGCNFDGLIDGCYEVGGIIGAAGDSSIIRNCSSAGEIYGNSNYGSSDSIGGIVGYADECRITGCYNKATIYAYNSQYVGGIAGCCYNYNSTWNNCYNIGEINGYSYAGGLLGYGNVSVIANSYNYGVVTDLQMTNVGIGSLVGQYADGEGQLLNCYYLTGMQPVGVQAEQLSTSVQEMSSVPAADYSGYAVEKTEEQFASGEVAYLLNETRMQNVTWYQTIGTEYPVLYTGDVVYAKGTTDCAGNLITFEGFTNAAIEKASGEEHVYTDGFCKFCRWMENLAIPQKDENGVYQIGTSEELYGFAAIVNGFYQLTGWEPAANAVLTADIAVNENVLDANGMPQGNPEDYLAWIPIGRGETTELTYNGTFDGQGHTVSGLVCVNEGCAGLFGALSGACVKDVTITDSCFVSECDYAGGVSAYAYNNSKIIGCVNEGYVCSGSLAGGIAGLICKTSSIEKCGNRGTVINENGTVGGIVGSIQQEVNQESLNDEEAQINTGMAVLLNCYNTGNVIGYHAGGIAGEYYGTERMLINCFNTGTVSLSSLDGYLGGISSYVYEDRFFNCYYNIDLFEEELIDNGQVFDANYAIGLTTEEIASGLLTYLLNKDMPMNWYQTIGIDSVPVLDSAHGKVYAGYADCNSEIPVLGNQPMTEERPDHVYEETNFEILAEASCQVAGVLVNECTICGKQVMEEIPASGHDMEHGIVTEIAATCLEEGVRTTICANDCGYTVKEIIPASGHKFGETADRIEPDDETGTNGMVYRKCQNDDCVEIHIEEILPVQVVKDAVTVLVDTSQATTVEKVSALSAADNQALLDYNKETIVSAVTKLDEDLKTEGINVGTDSSIQVKIGAVTYDADDSVTQVSKNAVSVDGASVTVAAAVAEGIAEDSAETGDTYAAQIALSEESTGTDENGKAYYQVDISLNIVKTSADGTESTVVAEQKQLEAPIVITMPVPECYQDMEFDLYHLVSNADGTITRVRISYTLSDDGQTITFVTPSLSFYSFENGRCTKHILIPDMESADSETATCTEPGIKVYRCVTRYCDYTEKENIPALMHNYELCDHEDATCQPGFDKYICGNCGAEKVVEINGYHIPGEWEETKAATCTEKGMRVQKCRICGTELSEEETAILEHTEGEWEEAKAATCTEKGMKVQKCSICGTKLAEEETAVLKHIEGSWEETKAATCTSKGMKVQKCSICGTKLAEEETAMLEHTEGEWEETKAATCTVKGMKIRKCSICGTKLAEEETAMLKHIEGSWEETKAATCTVKGMKVQKCSTCGTKLAEEETAVLKHIEGSWTETKAATCTSKGMKIQKCSICGTKLAEEETAMLKHIEGSWEETKAATCTEKGMKVQKCTVCGTKLKEEAIAAIGHNMGAWKETKASTKSSPEEVRTCQNKGCTKSETRTMTLAATSLTLKKNQSTKKFKITNLTAGDSVASITSSNKKIVAVKSYDANGSCSLKASKSKTGKAILTIKLASGMERTVTVKVQKSNVTTKSIKLETKSITIAKKKKYTIVPILNPITTQDKLSFTSKNKKIATVNSKGVVTAKKKGKTTITVKCGKKKVTLKVTVK